MHWLKKIFHRSGPRAETLGQFGERVARERYGRDGYRVLEQNVAARSSRQIGEVDFIAKRGQELVFVEVKTRSVARGAFGTPAEAVDRKKQVRLVRSVQSYLAAHPEFSALRHRIDVCAVVGSHLDGSVKSVTILANAVEDVG